MTVLVELSRGTALENIKFKVCILRVGWTKAQLWRTIKAIIQAGFKSGADLRICFNSPTSFLLDLQWGQCSVNYFLDFSKTFVSLFYCVNGPNITRL